MGMWYGSQVMADASGDVEMAVDDRKVGDPNPPEIKASGVELRAESFERPRSTRTC